MNERAATVTTKPDAFDIASLFFDSGKKRNDLEVAILRHMERHVIATRKAIFDKLMEAADVYNDRAVIRALLRQEMKT